VNSIRPHENVPGGGAARLAIGRVSAVVGPPLPAPDPQPISDGEWNKLLSRIERGNVIPVIGEALSVVHWGDPPVERPLGEHLAQSVAKLNRWSGAPPRTLNELVYRYMAENRLSIDDLYVDIFTCLRDMGGCPLPAPLLKLAAIRGFSLFVSTTFDSYMASALGEVRFGRRDSESTMVRSYQADSSVDIPKFGELDHPVVYHLFGRAQAGAGFAATDEDVLEFMHMLQDPDRQPRKLFDALHEGRLLVIGCGLSGWLARFFLRISSANRLLRESRADYLVEGATSEQRDQVLFFEHFGGAKVLGGPAIEFVDELYRRWKERHPDTQPSKPPRSGATSVSAQCDVFLSYAREDFEITKTLRERLETTGKIKVWIDAEGIRGGDQWEEKIEAALKACTLFVPILSRSVNIGQYRFVRKEWLCALDRQKGMRGDVTYILPLVIDGTRPDDPGFPPGIAATNWVRLEREEDMDAFTKVLLEAIERARAR
jgi:hypothetical protein